MAQQSKFSFEKLNAYSCHELFHPWNENCIYGNIDMAYTCFIGCVKFFSVMYAAQMLFNVYSNKKNNYKKEFRGFLGSLMFGTIYGTSFISLNCLLRKILGNYNYYMFSIFVPLCCGMPIFLENKQRRALESSTFLTMAYEGIYRSKFNRELTRLTKFGETIIFMGLNAVLMCCLRARFVDVHRQNYWYFVSPRLSSHSKDSNFSTEGQCPHKDTCAESLKKDLMKFGGISMLITVLKTVAFNIKTPSQILRKFFKWKNLQLPTFVVMYIGLYKIMSCYLCQTKGDSLGNTFLAGLVAGLSYAISPNKTILFSVLTALTLICGNYIKNEYKIPNIPFTEICFIVTNAYMINLRMFDKFSCPKYVYELINFCTQNKSEVINRGFFRILYSH